MTQKIEILKACRVS